MGGPSHQGDSGWATARETPPQAKGRTPGDGTTVPVLLILFDRQLSITSGRGRCKAAAWEESLPLPGAIQPAWVLGTPRGTRPSAAWKGLLPWEQGRGVGGAWRQRKGKEGAGGRTRRASETKKICTRPGWAVAGEAVPRQRLPLLAPPLSWSPWQRAH